MKSIKFKNENNEWIIWYIGNVKMTYSRSYEIQCFNFLRGISKISRKYLIINLKRKV